MPSLQSSLKILIVDEHAPSIAVLSHALASRGHACEAVATVENALACAASLALDVVIYEWNLRGGAHGFVRRLRATSVTRVRVIALSAQDEPAGFRDDEDVDAYLVKPFDIEQLESVLR